MNPLFRPRKHSHLHSQKSKECIYGQFIISKGRRADEKPVFLSTRPSFELVSSSVFQQKIASPFHPAQDIFDVGAP